MTDQAVLEHERYAPFNAVRMDLPGFTARFFTGLGDLPLLGQTFQGAGELAEVGVIEGRLDTAATRVNLGLTGLDNSLFAEMRDYMVRLSNVYVWFGCLDLTTYRPHGAPDLVMTGKIGSPQFKVGRTTSIKVPVLGAMEWSKRRTVRRRQPGYHKAIFPNDEYFAFYAENDEVFPFGDQGALNPRDERTGKGPSVEEIVRYQVRKAL